MDFLKPTTYLNKNEQPKSAKISDKKQNSAMANNILDMALRRKKMQADLNQVQYGKTNQESFNESSQNPLQDIQTNIKRRTFKINDSKARQPETPVQYIRSYNNRKPQNKNIAPTKYFQFPQKPSLIASTYNYSPTSTISSANPILSFPQPIVTQIRYFDPIIISSSPVRAPQSEQSVPEKAVIDQIQQLNSQEPKKILSKPLAINNKIKPEEKKQKRKKPKNKTKKVPVQPLKVQDSIIEPEIQTKNQLAVIDQQKHQNQLKELKKQRQENQELIRKQKQLINVLEKKMSDGLIQKNAYDAAIAKVNQNIYNLIQNIATIETTTEQITTYYQNQAQEQTRQKRRKKKMKKVKKKKNDNPLAALLGATNQSDDIQLSRADSQYVSNGLGDLSAFSNISNQQNKRLVYKNDESEDFQLDQAQGEQQPGLFKVLKQLKDKNDQTQSQLQSQNNSQEDQEKKKIDEEKQRKRALQQQMQAISAKMNKQIDQEISKLTENQKMLQNIEQRQNEIQRKALENAFKDMQGQMKLTGKKCVEGLKVMDTLLKKYLPLQQTGSSLGFSKSKESSQFGFFLDTRSS